MSAFVVSLDFEMFWGVSDIATVQQYGAHVAGEWAAVPQILELFSRYGVRATWATVGMLMCRDYADWRARCPAELPAYANGRLSNYTIGPLVMQHPDLFFGRPLVEQILDTPGQELGSHTYSHFYCGELGATPEAFAADLQLATGICAEVGAPEPRSIVFPRNQCIDSFMPVVSGSGFQVIRGNSSSWLYCDGHRLRFGVFGRAARLVDSFIPLSGPNTWIPHRRGLLTNVPASLFLRPYTAKLGKLQQSGVRRINQAMTHAATNGEIFHLWWHPHNFGVDLERNLGNLKAVLEHFASLRQNYGMRSACMADFA